MEESINYRDMRNERQSYDKNKGGKYMYSIGCECDGFKSKAWSYVRLCNMYITIKYSKSC